MRFVKEAMKEAMMAGTAQNTHNIHTFRTLTSGAEGVAEGQGASASVDLGEVKVTDNLASGQAVRAELLAAHRSHVRKHLTC